MSIGTESVSGASSILTSENVLRATRNRFVELCEQGFRQVDYLAREVWPALYSAIPAMAIHEARMHLDDYLAGRLVHDSGIVQNHETVSEPNLGESTMAKKAAKPKKNEEPDESSANEPRQVHKRGRGRPPKPKQKELPGIESETIPEIEKAAEAYVQVRDERMELTEEETSAQAKLLELMRKHKLDKYKFDGKIVAVLEGEAKVKVKKAKDPTEG